MIKTIYAFASGKEINFGERLNFLETDLFLDFNKDVDFFGYSLHNYVDIILDNISRLNAIIFSDTILTGTIEFKAKGKNLTTKKEFKLGLGQNNIQIKIPELSSRINEVVLSFPKKLNSYVADGTIPCIRFEKIELE